ncbi:MAG: hypothetical protein ABIN93_10085 [Ginsengibacter sp.]
MKEANFEKLLEMVREEAAKNDLAEEVLQQLLNESKLNFCKSEI